VGQHEEDKENLVPDGRDREEYRWRSCHEGDCGGTWSRWGRVAAA
jgi:hypothetical protein